MGLFEFFGERYNPGNIGKVEKNKCTTNCSVGMLIFKSIVSVAILVGVYMLISEGTFQIKRLLAYLGVMFVYCVISYWIIPKPDYSNVGWLGGLIDHPFRYSDDMNRMLFFLMIILYPGRFISTTTVHWIRLLRLY